MKYYIYDKKSGEIKRTLDTDPELLSVQYDPDKEEFFLNADKDVPATHIVKNKAVVKNVAPVTMPVTLESIRFQRNLLLAATDYTMLYDSALSNAKQKLFVKYRQELRDFPATCNPDNLVWPTPPLMQKEIDD